MKIELECIKCNEKYEHDSSRCNCRCGGTLDVRHDLEKLKSVDLVSLWEGRWGTRKFPHNSGVWRYRELMMPVADEFIVSRSEGNTNIYTSAKISEYCDLENISLKHEGENPTGSFKDRGMTVGMTAARLFGYDTVACASTGNTSASMSSYASAGNIRPIVIIPDGEIAFGKLSQALAYGGKTLQIAGDFDQAMELVQQVCRKFGIYMLNSLNPYRIEGQKAIVFEILQQLDWVVPDWIVLPGGNLGNSSAVAKGLMELYQLGIIHKRPKLAVIQAQGANPLFRSYRSNFDSFSPVKAKTIATAIKIGAPVNVDKCRRGIIWSAGLVEELSEEEILEAKAVVDCSGIGAEPASCCTVGGIRKLRRAGLVKPDDRVVGILTGHLLKDPDSTINFHMGKLDIKSSHVNPPRKIDADLSAIQTALGL